MTEIDHTRVAVASRIHSIHAAAYALEAILLGIAAEEFPPLRRTVADLRSDRACYFVAVLTDEIVAAASVERAVGDRCASIASFVVAPEVQRQGVGARLLSGIVARHEPADLAVETAVGNLPALGLYTKFDFVETQRRLVSSLQLELVELRRFGGR